jgi:MoaA/NifB/PqqE/SkfB family radical SAM enzyme
VQWIELSPGFACNCRCLGCFSCSADPALQMSWKDVLRWLHNGRKEGARHLWLSGGEPTLRRDFFRTLKAAKKLGYERIKVQSNGMLFAYDGFAERAVAAGMTEINLLIKSLDPKVHDALNRTPESHRLLHEGIAKLRALNANGAGIRFEGDILMTTRNYMEMSRLVEYYCDLDFVHFNVWLFSLVDQGKRDFRRLVPRLSDCLPHMLSAFDAAKSRGATFCSLNTPFCVIPPAYWEMQFDSSGMDLLVVNPGERAFMLETSSIEKGIYFERCADCAVRSACHGMRSDYLSVHGDAEIQPLSAEQVDGYEAVGQLLDL